MSTVKFLEASAITYKNGHKDHVPWASVEAREKRKLTDTVKTEAYNYELHGG